MKCILINPPLTPYPQYTSDLPTGEEINPPLGLAYLAAVLRDMKVETSIIDANALNIPLDSIMSRIMKIQPEMVGITMFTPWYPTVIELSKQIKDNLPETKVIVGGPHVSAMYEEVIRENPTVDIAVKGEGEIIIGEIVKAIRGEKDFSDIKGISFREGGKVISTPDAGSIMELDDIPFPARDLLPLDIYRAPISLGGGTGYNSIMTSRGCPFSCKFCSVWITWGRNHRRRSVDNVLAEWEEIRNKHGIKTLRVLDDLFCTNKQWAMDVCDGLIERGLNDIKWETSGRVGLMSPDLLEKMKKAGCEVIEYGIEFGNQRILDFARKGFKINQVYETIKMAKKVGISSKGLFMIGYPTETIETIEDTIKLPIDLKLDYSVFGIVTPYPGTELYDYCVENDLLKTMDWGEYQRDHEGSLIKLDVSDEKLVELYKKACRTTVYNLPYAMRMSLKHPKIAVKHGPRLLKSYLKGLKIKRMFH